MCGIAGIFKAGADSVSPEETHLLVEALRHRGPDGNGVWTNPESQLALVHTRLSILDLSEQAAQPMLSGDGRHVITYNGEIYNFLELRTELESHGARFQTESDTEVILHAWSRWGERMLDRFNGMWAFGIYDRENGELFLARDRYGIKPLYYHQSPDGGFFFASEAQALRRLLGDRIPPDPGFLAQLLQYEVEPYSGEDTWFAGVKSLPAGHWLRFSRGHLQVARWYTLRPRDVPHRYDEQCEEFRTLLEDACRLRLRSDVPVATCLSGGIDSGSIVSLLGREKSAGSGRFSHFQHRSFNAAFPGSHLDESDDARLVARTAGMDFDSAIVDCPSPDELEQALSSCDGPMPALAFYPIWKLYGHIKRNGISVTIDGQGADEMLGGYYLGYPALRGAWQSGNLLWLRDVAKTYAALHPDADCWMRNDWRAFRTTAASDINQWLKRPIKRLLAAFSLYDFGRMKPTKTLPVPDVLALDDPRRGNEFVTALWRQFFVKPLPFLLYQYDRCSMAHGVECRMPFMDYRLVEYVYSLPLASRVGRGYTKRILRESMGGILPEKVRGNRTKTGFNAPFGDWMQGPLREWALDLAATPEFREAAVLAGREEASVRMVAEETPGNERELWPLLHTAHWLRHLRANT